jgi:lipopolysaccharide export system permease protein
VSVSSVRRRGGMGINLAMGILMGFSFIFIDKVLVVLVNKSNFPASIAAWSPIIFFGGLGYFIMRYAKR